MTTNLEGGQRKGKEMNPEFLSHCVHVVLPSCLPLALAASTNVPPVPREETMGSRGVSLPSESGVTVDLQGRQDGGA